MNRLSFIFALLALASCAGYEHDARLVVSEQQRMTALSDPAVLKATLESATAAKLPVDAGRWEGKLATTAPAATQSAAGQTTQPVLALTIEQAVLMALQRNRDLVVQRFGPEISRYSEEGAYGQFDPTLSASASVSRTVPAAGQFGQVGSKTLDAQAGLQQFFATGTTVGIGVSAVESGSHLYGDNSNASTSVRAGFSVTQSLLQGGGLRVNLASIRQAELDVITSRYELRGFTESLAASTEDAYIDEVLAQRELEIAESALTVSQEQLTETDALIASGKSAASDRASAVATQAQRRVDLINARSTLEQNRLRFLRFVNAPDASAAGGWDERVELTQPAVPVGGLDDVESHVRVALRFRSDLNQARLQEERGDLAIVKTRDGLLPRLDLFAGFGRTFSRTHRRGINSTTAGRTTETLG